MTLVPSLLQAIIRLDGEAVVMHVGDRPYVVTPAGQVDLATRGLTLDAVTSIVNQLLPLHAQGALEEFGATQYELPMLAEFPGESFIVVAARGGDDVWAEIRRKRVSVEGHGLLDFDVASPVSETAAENPPPAVAPQPVEVAQDDLILPDAGQFWPVPQPVEPEAAHPVAPASQTELRAPVVTPPAAPVSVPRSAAGASVPPPVHDREETPAAPTASVLPMTRNPIRPDVPPPLSGQSLSSLDQWLRLAAARGAAVLYLSSAARPSIRVDGEIFALEGAPLLGPNDVESLLLTLMPDRNAEALRTGVASEWMYDLADVGRVRCLGFRDHSGPGGVFRILPARAVTADQLGLTRETQALMSEPGGLVLVVGPRSSGKRTLMAAFVDRISRTRRDHVISIETEINVEHERSGSLISQREVPGGTEAMCAAARAALREDPDVLVLEGVRTAALMNVALDAAASGQLVIAGFPANDATGAIDRIIDLYPPELRRQVQIALAQDLRGVIAQVLLKKRGGGRVAARELLLNTAAVAGALAEGRTSQLPLAIEGGRKAGMMSLNDALVAYVQSGVVDMHEAYRRSANRTGFIALLKKQGVDTSTIERLGSATL